MEPVKNLIAQFVSKAPMAQLFPRCISNGKTFAHELIMEFTINSLNLINLIFYSWSRLCLMCDAFEACHFVPSQLKPQHPCRASLASHKKVSHAWFNWKTWNILGRFHCALFPLTVMRVMIDWISNVILFWKVLNGLIDFKRVLSSEKRLRRFHTCFPCVLCKHHRDWKSPFYR